MREIFRETFGKYFNKYLFLFGVLFIHSVIFQDKYHTLGEFTANELCLLKGCLFANVICAVLPPNSRRGFCKSGKKSVLN